MSRGMKIGEAKKYVAGKLGCSIEDLTDSVIMAEVREDLQVGCMNQLPGSAKCIESKFRIAKLLDIEINGVEKFKQRAGI